MKPETQNASEPRWLSKTKLGLILNGILMQVLWFAAVLGASQQAILWALLSFGLLATCALLTAQNVQADLRMAFVGCLIAFTFEPVWMGANLVDYAHGSDKWFPPLWITLLWAGLGISCNHSLLWLKQRLAWAAAVGGLAAIGSINAAYRLGALEMPEGNLKFSIVYGGCWLVIFPGMLWLAGSRSSDEENT